MRYSAISEKGHRLKNEDCYYIPCDERPGLVLVADGMGGHKGGMRASAMAVDTISSLVEEGSAKNTETLLTKAVRGANRKIYDTAAQDPECRGMGTTAVMAYLKPEHYHAANVGDSRLYHYNKVELKQISRDHSFVAALVASGEITKAQAAKHPQRNIITRALGTNRDERVDLFFENWEPGDILLLCSDGMYSAIDEDEIYSILDSDKDLDTKCQMLVDAALAGGSTDNITVVLACNEEVNEA